MRDYLENDIKISIALSNMGDPEAVELFRRARLERERNQKAREEQSKQEILLRQEARREEELLRKERRRKEDRRLAIKNSFLFSLFLLSLCFRCSHII